MRYVTLLAASLLAMLATRDDDLKTIQVGGRACGPEGTATSEGGKDLNRHKNRYQEPDEGDIDPNASLPAMLVPGKDVDRFDQEKAAVIRGFVMNVKVGGKESCNCEATAPDERDTHIELSLSKSARPNQRVIVEVTPRLRLKMKKKGIDWTTDKLRARIRGKWVEVTGWLLFDTAHIKEAENTHPGNRANWRATCWEVHPVTAIKVLDGPPAGAEAFRPSSLAALQALHARHVARSPKGKEAVEKLHKKYRNKFSDGELKEAEEQAEPRRKEAEEQAEPRRKDR